MVRVREIYRGRGLTGIFLGIWLAHRGLGLRLAVGLV
jgi:hypothetical protein